MIPNLLLTPRSALDLFYDHWPEGRDGQELREVPPEALCHNGNVDEPVGRLESLSTTDFKPYKSTNPRYDLIVLCPAL